MPRKKSTTPDVVVSGKDYLREVPKSVSEDILNDYSTPILLLYRSSDYYSYSNSFFPTETSTYIFVHGCNEGNGKPQKFVRDNKKGGYSVVTKCKFCGRDIEMHGYNNSATIATSECNSLISRKYSKVKESTKATDVLYMSHHPEDANISIARLLSVGYSYENGDEPGQYKILNDCTPKTALEIIPGVSIKGYKTLKKSIKEMSAFEAMNINSQTINSSWSRRFVFENAVDLIDYINKDKIFAERTGIKQAFKMLPSDMSNLNQDPFMLLHMCMISEYPVLELLIKMGYSRLYFDIIRTFLRAQSKEDILEKVKVFQTLFTKSSKGSSGLRIPNYIGDYLKTKASPITEYRLWCDIYELQAMTKEQFNNYIDSIEYIAASVSRCLPFMPNIIKYGYTMEQATKYLYKQSLICKKRGQKRNMRDIASDMRDYLTMCEYLDIEPNKFPSDMKQSHDEVSKLRSSSHKTDYSKMISLGKTTQTLLDSFIDETKLTKMEEDYFIKVPTSEADFIEEGNLQNSCVGHYAKKVNAGERIVFFVRKKDEPRNSFITAEYVCSTGQLGQCMYANNREVEDEDLLGYCKVACGRIKTGLLTGKIA